jgi:peptidyl-dipeptidase Dcp
VLSFDNADLEGLSANDLAAAKIKATEAGHEGQYLIGLQNTTQQYYKTLAIEQLEKIFKRLGLGLKKMTMVILARY